MHRTLALLLFVAQLIAGSVRGAATDGIFAEFTTSMGSFTCRLDYAIAPKAVANFVGLATGERAWLDAATGAARTNAFFDGLTFHRVISGFMIQGGSPNGQGTDGPGYAFIDEFNASARFTGTGVLAMANSGPDSNGSQFFITVGPATHLNDVHTIFGHVTAGTNVVIAISKVATDANSKPLTNVVVQSVRIRRVGAAAEAFNIHAQELPVVANEPLTVTPGAAGGLSLEFANRAYSENRLYASTNLVHWTASPLGIELEKPLPGEVDWTNRYPREFFRLSQARYASSTFAPRDLQGRELTLFLLGNPPITNFFNAQGTGTYRFGTSEGQITGYTWQQEPYRGRLWPIQFTGVWPMTLRLDFTNSTGGAVSGNVYVNGFPSATSGAFLLK